MRRKVKKPAWFEILTSNWPEEFADHIPKKKENDRLNKAPEWFVDDLSGETVACGFKDKKSAREYKNKYVPGGFIRCYHPTIKDHEKNLSERRQERRFQALSSGRSK